MFQKIVNDALNFGMGVTVTGKDKAEKLAKKLQDKCGVTKAESEKMVKEMISRGEKIRKQFEKDLLQTQEELFDKLEKFAKANKESIQKKTKPQPKAKKAAPKKAKPKAKPKTETK